MVSDAVFESTLSMEEIEKNFAEMDLFSDLMESLEEALAYSQEKVKS